MQLAWLYGGGMHSEMGRERIIPCLIANCTLLLPCMTVTFDWMLHCGVFLVGCWIFLCYYKYPIPLIWHAVKLLGNSLTLWSFAFKICYSGSEQHHFPLVRQNSSEYSAQCAMKYETFCSISWEQKLFPDNHSFLFSLILQMRTWAISSQVLEWYFADFGILGSSLWNSDLRPLVALLSSDSALSP
jgi:hypothetical protein